jgi:tetratricopeptide (TPR) repeat protein
MATSARLEELKKKFEENPRRYFAPLANEFRKQGDLTQAIALCRTHLPNQTGHISGHIVLAQALFEARAFPESRQVFEQALELDPENLIALRTLGDIARELGDTPVARRWYERVLEADPRNDEIGQILRNLPVSSNGHASAPDEPAEDAAPADVAVAEDPNRTPIFTPAVPEEGGDVGVGTEVGASAVESSRPTPLVTEAIHESMDVEAFAAGVEPDSAQLETHDPFDMSERAGAFDASSLGVQGIDRDALDEISAAQTQEISMADLPIEHFEQEFEPDVDAFTAKHGLHDLGELEAMAEPVADDWFADAASAPAEAGDGAAAEPEVYAEPMAVEVGPEASLATDFSDATDAAVLSLGEDELVVASERETVDLPAVTEDEQSRPTPNAVDVVQSESETFARVEDAPTTHAEPAMVDEAAAPSVATSADEESGREVAFAEPVADEAGAPGYEVTAADAAPVLDVSDTPAPPAESAAPNEPWSAPESLEQVAPPAPAGVWMPDDEYVPAASASVPSATPEPEAIVSSSAVEPEPVQSEVVAKVDVAPPAVAGDAERFTNDPYYGRTPTFGSPTVDETPAGFVTETMAELYLQQGFTATTGSGRGSTRWSAARDRASPRSASRRGRRRPRWTRRDSRCGRSSAGSPGARRRAARARSRHPQARSPRRSTRRR